MGLNSSVSVIGLETSNLGPNLYRDGGGGAIINGLNIVWYSDGIWTKGGAPTAGLDNWLNFSSNSITVSSYQGAGINNMFDFGTTDKGPNQQVPFFYESGEGDNSHGIWPNQNLVTLCGGGCAVGFPEVVDRRTEDGASLLYNTAVRIEFNAYGPVVTRPVKALFNAGEPTYGSFCSHNGLDGYIYMYAKITQTSGSNGLKLARVPNTQYHQRSEYQYWDGNAWVGQIPAYDNADANTFSWSQNQFGTYYGPGYGDVFWSDISNTYVMLFQSGAPALDDNLYISYSTKLESGWTVPTSIWKIPRYSDGYSYSFHVYPHMDPSGKAIPFSWNKYRVPHQYDVGWGVINFSPTS